MAGRSATCPTGTRRTTRAAASPDGAGGDDRALVPRAVVGSTGRASAASANPSVPSRRAAVARTATAPPRPTIRPAVTICSSADGVPSRPTPTSSAPCIRSSSPIPTRRTSRPVMSGATASAARANPAACAMGGPRPAAPSPCWSNPTTAAAAARARLGGPADPRPAGRRLAVADGDPEQVHRRGRRPRRAPPCPSVAVTGSAMAGAAIMVTASPRTAVRASRAETATIAPTMTASATPARAGFMAWLVPAPGRWASGGSRTCRAASSGARPGR